MGTAEDGGPRFGAGCVTVPASHGPWGAGRQVVLAGGKVSCHWDEAERQNRSVSLRALIFTQQSARAVPCPPMLSFPQAPHRYCVLTQANGIRSTLAEMCKA